jgi:uncharacterized repeat protein (TIGR03803 family)
MTSFRLGRYAVSIIAGLALLAACGQSQSPIGALSATQQVPARMPRQNADAKGVFKVLYNFVGSPDGSEPLSGVEADDPASQPYVTGATIMGGDANNDGTVYGLTKGKKGSSTESVLYTFSGYPNDGSEPVSVRKIKGIAAGSDYFITTLAGGATNNGTVAELTPNSSGPWTESFVYSFAGTPDGANPWAPVIADKAGNLYGTTSAGGTDNAGTVYRMSPKASSYSETVLYSFQGGTDGDAPYAGLIMDKKGALYGTTVLGGSSGLGAVFKLTPSRSGYTESILYSFQGPPNDGQYPYGPLTPSGGSLALAADGKVVGMTSGGGNQGDGIVYELTVSGSSAKESVLWNFGNVSGDGAVPYGGVCIDKKGVIYGTTESGGSGGSSGLGTFFTLTPSSGTYKESVYSFIGANGAHPYAGPTVDSKGNLYVTTRSGGSKDKGAVLHWALEVRVQRVCE